MNDFIPLIVVIIFIALFYNIFRASYKGGLRNNLLNYFLITTFIIYLIITPIVYFYTNQFMAFQMNVKDYFGIGFLQILLHLFFYNFGYFCLLRSSKNSGKFTDIKKRIAFGNQIEFKILMIFLIIFSSVFINTLSVGINLIDVVLGKFGDPTLGLKGGSYYIQNLADSLIGILIIAYYFKIKPKYFYFMLLLSLPLFLVLGFRYRLILTFFGIVLVYIFDNKLGFKSLIKYLMILGISFYCLILLTQNRTAIYMQKYENITFNISEFDYEIIFSQSRGSMIDFAVYQHFGNGKANIDFGETMFGYIFIKMLPASFFKSGVKPYPPPSFYVIDDAINGTRDNGEAVTSLGGTFIAFYYPGIYFFAFILGCAIAKLQNRIEKTYFSFLGGVLTVLAIFQWVTRGYFPQFIDHLAYILFPLILLNMFSRKEIAKSVIK